MPTPQRWKAYTWEDVAVVLYDLVKGAAGSNVTIASLSALTAKVFHGDTLAQVQMGLKHPVRRSQPRSSTVTRWLR